MRRQNDILKNDTLNKQNNVKRKAINIKILLKNGSITKHMKHNV